MLECSSVLRDHPPPRTLWERSRTPPWHVTCFYWGHVMRQSLLSPQKGKPLLGHARLKPWQSYVVTHVSYRCGGPTSLPHPDMDLPSPPRAQKLITWPHGLCAEQTSLFLFRRTNWRVPGPRQQSLAAARAVLPASAALSYRQEVHGRLWNARRGAEGSHCRAGGPSPDIPLQWTHEIAPLMPSDIYATDLHLVHKMAPCC